MRLFSHSADTGMFPRFRQEGIDGRILRSMAAATALSVLATAPFMPVRVTVGLVLGGLLALLNYCWLSNSATAAMSVVGHGAKPKLGLAQFILRYAIIAAAIYLAHLLNIVSLPAAIVGLSTFVVALFVEAFRELYFAIIHREGVS